MQSLWVQQHHLPYLLQMLLENSIKHYLTQSKRLSFYSTLFIFIALLYCLHSHIAHLILIKPFKPLMI